MRIAILGASGCIGVELTRYLLDHSTYDLVLFSHHAKDLHYSPAEELRLRHINGDILNQSDINKALQNCDLVVYLIHLMGNKNVGAQFHSAEEVAANNLIQSAQRNDVQRIIYIGGAGNDNDTPTQHLKSRHNTGVIFRKSIDEVVEYRTPMVIGKGAAGYEVIRGMVRKMPVIPIPSWGNSVTQPINVSDVIRYIDAAIVSQNPGHTIVDIGGPELLTYSQIFRRYAAFKGYKRLIKVTPFVPKALVRIFFRFNKNNVHMVTAADMIESSQHSYHVKSAQPSFVRHIKPKSIEHGFY